MNKNRYKLIFSKTKGCLVPVAETINSAVGNASSKDVSDTEISASQPALNSPLSTLSVLVKTAFNPVSTLMSLTWKEYAVLLLVWCLFLLWHKPLIQIQWYKENLN